MRGRVGREAVKSPLNGGDPDEGVGALLDLERFWSTSTEHPVNQRQKMNETR